MSWLTKLLPPKINRDSKNGKSTVPEGLWSKCAACEAVLYHTDLESNLQVCPKCSHHNAVGARARLDMLLDAEGRAIDLLLKHEDGRIEHPALPANAQPGNWPS